MPRMGGAAFFFGERGEASGQFRPWPAGMGPELRMSGGPGTADASRMREVFELSLRLMSVYRLHCIFEKRRVREH